MKTRNPDGSVLENPPFSASAIYAILADPRAAHIREWVLNAAVDDERVLALAEATDAGNSVSGSGGS